MEAMTDADVQRTIYSKGRVSKIRKSISRKHNCNKIRAPVLETICHGDEKHSLSKSDSSGSTNQLCLEVVRIPSITSDSNPTQIAHTKKGGLAGYGRAS